MIHNALPLTLLRGALHRPPMQPCPVPGWSGPGRLIRLASDGCKPAVLMTHGTFSTAETCLPLARFLCEAGHPVYIVEWRGRSGKPGRFDFHDLAQGEIAGALGTLDAPAHLLAHSGGGLAMIFAALRPALRPKIRSLTLIATQGTHLRSAPLLPYLGIRGLELWGRLRRRWTAQLLGLGPANESAALLSQWVEFNRAGCITNKAGANVEPDLAALDLPVFALAGAADRIIAPPAGCFALARAFGNASRTHLCQKATDGEDFTHSRLIKSRNAARFVWPRIAAFLESHEQAGNSRPTGLHSGCEPG